MMFTDHFVFMVADLDRTEAFYTALLGKPIGRTEHSVVYRLGEAKYFFGLPYNEHGNSGNKDSAGNFNHMAFGVEEMPELIEMDRRLILAGIPHSAIQKCEESGKDYIWMNDPDGFRIEIYLRGRNRASVSWEE